MSIGVFTPAKNVLLSVLIVITVSTLVFTITITIIIIILILISHILIKSIHGMLVCIVSVHDLVGSASIPSLLHIQVLIILELLESL